jgi:pimeloyl-ACP methyl ester carboxylesterase
VEVGLAVVATGLALGLCAARLSLAADGLAGAGPAPRPSLGLQAGVAADEALRLLIESRKLLRPSVAYAEIAAEARIAADRNAEEGWQAHPEMAHALPPPLEKFRCDRTSLRGVGAVEVLRFASDFEPQDPEVRDAYLAAAANRTAQAVLLRHAAGPRATLIYCHGYGFGQPWLDARVAGARRLHLELGLDVALFTLPLHGVRSLARRSGAAVLDQHPLFTNAVLGQAVWDLRRLTGFLRAAGSPAVGVFGHSLGGNVAAVFASVDERLASVIVMNAPARLDTLFWRQLPPGESALARASGLSEPLLAQAWSRHAPLRMRPQVAHERRLVIGGLADRVVEPEQTRELWEHWGRPGRHEYPGTHTLWLGRAALRAAIDAHLRATLLDLA